MGKQKAKYRGVMAGFIHYNGVPETFLRSMWQSVSAGVLRNYTSSSSSRTNAARTENGKQFLESNCQWYFLVDTDMSWEPADIKTLLTFAQKNNKKAVAGFALMANAEGIQPNAFRKGRGQRYPKWGPIEPFSEPIQVDAVGGSCFLVHRDVMEDVYEQSLHQGDTAYFWQEEVYLDELGMHRGEDVEFSDRITRAGHEIWYHPGAIFVHHKVQDVGPGQYLQYLQAVAARNIPGQQTLV